MWCHLLQVYGTASSRLPCWPVMVLWCPFCPPEGGGQSRWQHRLFPIWTKWNWPSRNRGPDGSRGKRESIVGVQAESKDGPVKVTRRQLWMDLIKAGVDPETINKQPNTVLVALWQQLKLEQKFQPLLDRLAPVCTFEWTSSRGYSQPSAPCLDDFLWDQDMSKIFTHSRSIRLYLGRTTMGLHCPTYGVSP